MPLSAPDTVYYNLAGLPREHRFLRRFEDYPRVRAFIHGADFVAEHPLEMVLSSWSLLICFSVFKHIRSAMMPEASSFSIFEASVGDTFQTLAWTTVIFLGLSAAYQWARGPKTPDPKAYQTYLSKLDAFPVDSDIDIYRRRVVTWPNQGDAAEEDYFVSWHSGHIAYLDKIHQWKTISYVMESVRRRFPVDSDQGYLYLRLARYVYRLRLNRSGLHAAEDPANLTKGMLQHWIRQVVVAPCARTAVECASFLSPLVDTEHIDSLLAKNAVNAKMFLSLSENDRQVVMDHLKAGDLRCQLVALNLLLDAEEPIPLYFLQGFLSKLMLASAETDEEKTTLHNIAHAIISHLLQQDSVELSPQAAAWLCHLYGKGENILLSLAGLYHDFPVAAYRKIVVLARHLLARTLDYMHETPVTFFDTETPAGVFYNPSLMRNEVFERGSQLVRVSVGYGVLDPLDLKKMILIGNVEEVHSFMTSLASTDMQPSNRDGLLVSLHYQLLFELVKRISEDCFSENDGQDGLRGRVLTVCLDSVVNINGFRDSSEESGLDEFDARAQHSLFPIMRPVGRNISFFLFKALLEARSIAINVRCYYFLRALDQYTQLINADSSTAVFYDCQETATKFQQKTGAVSLLLGWLAALVSCKNEQADEVAFDLLIGVAKKEFTNLLRDVPGGTLRLLQAIGTMDDEQLEAYFVAVLAYGERDQASVGLAQYSLMNCLWAQHVAERPDRAWKVFGTVLQLWKKQDDTPDINHVFDRLGFLQSGRRPYQSSPERFRVMNPMLAYCLEQPAAEIGRKMFLRFVETCRAEDISQHLSIFSSFLPINNAEGPEQLSTWMASRATDRFIAMYIFALHPPEYFAPYEATSGIFKKEPYLFVEEIQKILTAFNKNPSLNHYSNFTIKTELETFYHDKRWADRLTNACDSVELKRNYGAVTILV